MSTEDFKKLFDKVIKDLKEQEGEVYDVCIHADEVLLVIEKLQKQNEKLKEALSYYCAHQLYEPMIGMRLDEKTAKLIYEMGGIARDALKEIEDEK